MKEFLIDTHTWECDSDSINLRYCECNPERFLFFVKNDFVLITYYKCHSYGDHLRTKKELVQKIITDNSIFELYEVNRGVDVFNDLRDFRIRNRALRKVIQQVNYLYSDNAKKRYAITTTTKYIDAICDQEIIDSNFLLARKFLQEKEYTFLIYELDDLYYHNRLYNIDDVEICKTIDYLVDSINKLIK